MNLFAAVLTQVAPSANYRGDKELNRLVLQRITRDRFEYPVISAESMRNALREMLRAYRMPSNRNRPPDPQEPTVHYQEFPHPQKYADDFIFGYLVAAGPADREAHRKREQPRELRFKRDSILRLNLAVALEPYRHDKLLTQSPLIDKSSPWQNDTNSALLNPELAYTAYQYPFGLNGNDFHLGDDKCPEELRDRYADWLVNLLRAIAELSGVAGNQARSFFVMEPKSVIIRLTDRLAPGFDLYPFQSGGSAVDVMEAIRLGDIPGSEFIIGGRIVTHGLTAEQSKTWIEQLDGKEESGNSAKRGPQPSQPKLFRTAEQALDAAARELTGRGFLKEDRRGVPLGDTPDGASEIP
ncbi:MAG: type I-B CRISPR-associated protein Cas7/Cst2/DevR [Dehalococcoidia bacterium]